MTELALFDYKLPEDLIAAVPAKKREKSRLLCLERKTGKVIHRESFWMIEECLEQGDLLILNDAKVSPARLEAKKKTGAKAEILLLGQPGGISPPASGEAIIWKALIKCSGKIRDNDILTTSPGEKDIEVIKNLGGGYAEITFHNQVRADEILKNAYIPIPPYIRRLRRKKGLPEHMRKLDRERYQTVYAGQPGAVAAPTAGLHFTEALLSSLRNKGVEIKRLTLMVGPGTFMPVRTSKIEEHVMQPEFYHLPGETADAIEKALKKRRRIVAAGTTTVRVLEYVARNANWSEHSGWSDIFIYPPFNFIATNALITNFHLPRSSLLALVSAFAGRENIIAAYEEAIDCRYRFYSYGDATFLH